MKAKLFLGLTFLFLIVDALCRGLVYAGETDSAKPKPPFRAEEIVLSVDQGSLFFFQPKEGKIYRYGPHGKFTRVYTIEELGKDLRVELKVE